MVIIWGVVAVLFLVDAALFWVIRRTHLSLHHMLEQTQTEPTPPYDDQAIRDTLGILRRDFGSDLEETATRIRNLTQAVAEGIERVDRSERRIGATIKRAQEKLALAGYEDPGVEAEVEGLRLLDGDGIGTGGLPAVPPDVGGAGDQRSSVPGVTVAQLQRVRGL